ncbi:MAG: phosphoglycerate dehydrogenase [Alphaproteobacteria bacterium]
MPKVLISDKMSNQATEIFHQRGIEVDVKTQLSDDELLAIIGEYDGLAIRSSTTATPALIEAGAAGNLKVIGRAGIGVDNVDQGAATAKGIVVMNTPFGNSITTAEHTISMMMALARQIPLANHSTQAGKWEKSKFMGVELRGKTLGLVGAGNIGGIVATLALGLKMKVVAFDPFLNEEKAKELGVKKLDLDSLLAQADFISVHTPLTDQTRHLLGAKNIAKCKKGVRLINCARGGIIDEKALLAALNDGRVAGAALDVFEQEPAKENILFGHESVICTPHLGASTSEAQEKVALQLAEQMSDYLLHGAITNALNMPSVSAEEAPILKPYMELAQDLGGFLGQINEGSLEQITISYCGHAAHLNIKPITQIMIASLLGPSMDGVNMVNAELKAKRRGIKISEVRTETCEDYRTLVKLEIITTQGKLSIHGTLYSATTPRIVAINDIQVELNLEGNMIYVLNNDRPKLVGNVGTLIGNAGLNIGTFALGRAAEGGMAISVLKLDAKPPADLLSALQGLDNVLQVMPLSFE